MWSRTGVSRSASAPASLRDRDVKSNSLITSAWPGSTLASRLRPVVVIETVMLRSSSGEGARVTSPAFSSRPAW